MAPSSRPQSSAAAALQDAIDVKINQAIFGFALAAAGLIVLGGVAYVCFVVVGRYRRKSVEVERERLPPRPLILPSKVEEAGRAPKRLILSPLFQLPVYDLEEANNGAFSEHANHSWRASLHAMGVGSVSSFDHGLESLKEDEDDNVSLAERQATLLNSARSPTPPLHQSDLSSDSPDSSLDSSAVETPIQSYALRAAAKSPPSTVVEVIQSRGSSPDIVIEDYAPYLCSDALSCSSSLSSAETFNDSLLRVPPMSWNAPRDAVSDPPTPLAKGTPKQLKKKSSMSKLVSVLGEISNVVRLRPELSSPATTPKKLQRSVRRGKENSVYSA